MRRRSVLMALVFLVACGGDPLERAAAYETSVTAPWLSDNLPVGEGNVVFSDSQMLTIRFKGGDRAALASAFDTALVAAGHARRVDTSASDMTSITYGEDGAAITALGVLELHQIVTVSLTRYTR